MVCEADKKMENEEELKKLKHGSELHVRKNQNNPSIILRLHRFHFHHQGSAELNISIAKLLCFSRDFDAKMLHTHRFAIFFAAKSEHFFHLNQLFLCFSIFYFVFRSKMFNLLLILTLF